MKYFSLAFILFMFVSSLSFAQRNQGNEDELLALQYFNAGEFEKAAVIYEKLYRRDPSMYNYNYYFECLLELEDYDKAEKFVQGVARKYPAVSRYKVDLGIIFEATGDMKKSDKAYNDAIASVQPAEENYLALAQYFSFRNRTQWAIKVFESAIQKISASNTLQYELTSLYFQERQFVQMFDVFYSVLNHPMSGLDDIQQRLIAYFGADPSGDISAQFVPYALRQSQKNASNTKYAEMLMWAYLQVGDYAKALQQALAMDRRQKADGNVVLGLVPVLVFNNEFDKAIEGLSFVIEKGEKSLNFNTARIMLFDARYKKAVSEVPADLSQLKLLENEISGFIHEAGVHVNTISLIMQLANVKAFYLDKPVEAKEWVDKAMKVPGVRGLLSAELKILMADIMLLTGEHWDASLLYSQVEKDFKHDTIGFKAKFKNAKFYFYIGEFDYAQTHLSILMASTSKLIANDAMELSLLITNNVGWDSSYIPLSYYARAEFLYMSKSPVQALYTLDSLINIFPSHLVLDEAHFLKAKIYMQMNEYVKASDELKQIIAVHYRDLLADDALFMLAGLYKDYLNDNEKSMELYWQLVSDFPSSVYARESRDYYRKLRDASPTP
jgi:tetratricopeptide (TPR) repeat protein